MLCSRFKQILLTKPTLYNNTNCRCFTRSSSNKTKCWSDTLFASFIRNRKDLRSMTSIRFLLKDLRVNRLWSFWTRNVIVVNTVRRLRRERSVRDVIYYFRQALLRPKRTFLLSAVAAYKVRAEEEYKPPPCESNITDNEIQELLNDFDAVEDLSRRTLYCTECKKRLVIEKKLPGVGYCTCKESTLPEPSKDGWVPYLEAENVIIWRKEYKPGQGLFAYKVFGRYSDVSAADYAAVQVDGAYRREWDSAVAALSVVQRSANGVPDQTVLHWEVLWPRFFANRDYVYIRRNKEFDIKPKRQPETRTEPRTPERESVHSNAKRKSEEIYKKLPKLPWFKEDPVDDENVSKIDTKLVNSDANLSKTDTELSKTDIKHGKTDPNVVEAADLNGSSNKAYVIVSRSCVHPDVPVTRHAIRVNEYWSNMVIRTVSGADKLGMEFVLTYYDEPAVGGLPTGVATWATGRAAPAYLSRMRLAAQDYRAYVRRRGDTEAPDFMPFGPDKVSFADIQELAILEEEMESSKQGPDMEHSDGSTKDQATQTDEVTVGIKFKIVELKVLDENTIGTNTFTKEISSKREKKEEDDDQEKTSEEEEDSASWWRQMYPFYYFL